MQNEQPTYVAYADECRFNVGRYRGIGLVTLSMKDQARVHRELRALLDESNVDELKWEKLRTAKYRFAALKAANYAIRSACTGALRVDVLVWDTLDRRHSIQGRDDIQNLQRMYYHLFKNVLLNRWPSCSAWHLFPDEHTGIDWQNVEDVLDNSGSRFEAENNLFTRGKLRFRLRRDFSIAKITPVRSNDAPGVQLADFFVGLAVYSRTSYEKFQSATFGRNEQQRCLSLGDETSMHLSNADNERCKVLAEFNASCKSNKLGVSLRTHRGLRTLNPESPVNFWWYEPQHDADRAPTKRG